MKKEIYREQNIARAVDAIDKYLSSSASWRYERDSTSSHSWTCPMGNQISAHLDLYAQSHIQFHSMSHLDLMDPKIQAILSSPAFSRYFSVEQTRMGIYVLTEISSRQLSDRHLGEYMIHLISHMEPITDLCNSTACQVAA